MKKIVLIVSFLITSITSNAQSWKIWPQSSFSSSDSSLVWNDATKKFNRVLRSTSSGTLNGLTDVHISGLANKNLLIYNSSISKWRNEAMSGDAIIDTSGVLTIENLAVNNAKIANSTIDLTTKVTGLLPLANGGIGVGTLTGIAKGNGTSAFTPAIEGTDYVSPSSLNKMKLNERTQIVGCGDSYTAGTGATTPTTQGFYYTFQAAVNGLSQNLGVGGTGGTGAFRQHCQNIAVNNLKPTLLLIGLNDITRDVSSKCINMIAGAHRAIFASQFLKTAVAANSGSVTTSGTWTTITAGTYNDKASLSLSGLGRTSSVSGSTLTYTSTGDNVVIGTWGCDQAQFADGGFTVTIDGTLTATYNPTGKAKYISGVTDSGGRERFIGRSNDAVIIRGLSGGTHTVVITTTTNTPTLIDYIGVMNAPNLVAPIVFGTLPKINASAKAYFLSTYSITLTDTDFDNVDVAITSVINEFVGMPIGKFNTNKYYDCNTQAELVPSYIHPNSIGHGNIARSALELVDGVTIGGRQTIKNSLSSTIYRALNDIDNTAQLYITPSTQATTGLLSANAVLLDASSGNLMMGTQAAAKVGLYVSSTEVFNVTGTTLDYLATTTAAPTFTGTSCNLRAKATSTGSASNLLATNDASLSAQIAMYGSAQSIAGIVGPSYSAHIGNTLKARFGTINASGQIDFWVGLSSDAAATAVKATILANGNIGIGVATPTAVLHLKAGTATANTAPLKLTSGTNLTTPETGAIEYNGTNLFFTRTGTTRESIMSANSVNTVSPTAPDRTITVIINGTTYYLSAKTTND